LTDWPAIVRDHGPPAYATAWHILGNVSDTEDAVQEAFLDALRLAQRETVENWGALLRRLAGCRALDLLRKRRRTEPIAAELPAPSASHPDAVAVAAERAQLLRQALTQLPARQAEVFSLRYFGQMSNTEIAVALGISAGAVAIALYKARTYLQTVLEPDEE
jgi:RNA polymerase sigma-70 factor (ECF subfamily)